MAILLRVPKWPASLVQSQSYVESVALPIGTKCTVQLISVSSFAGILS